MSELPRIAAREAIAAFARLGFREARVSGSHRILKKDGHPNVLSVPDHGKKTLKRGTLSGLIKASGHTVEEFCDALNS
jgi:predicted RNA binding protein YcfA (HicA-like mRNA interferase family)